MSDTQNKYQKRIITIPNILSFLRLCLIPVLVWLYCYKEDYIWSIIVLVLSGLTDVIDGYIARHFKMVSDFGKAFDPVADKLTQFAMLMCLISHFPNMVIPVVVLAVKEIAASILSILAIRKSGEVHGAVWHGKLTTVMLYGTIFLHLAWHAIPVLFSNIMIAVCTIMMIFSALMYAITNIHILINKSDNSSKA